MTLRSIVCLLLFIGFVTQGFADCRTDIPRSTPSSAFTLHQDGTATHTVTGLMWMRCALGQIWNGSNCVSGAAAASFDWSQALQAAVASRFAGYSDWRLPNVKELKSIVERACFFPSINTEVFPAAPVAWFWSSSPHAGYPGYAWGVYFGSGFVDYGGKTGDGSVRLVRGGQ